MIEYEGMAFKNPMAKDEFLKNREKRRTENLEKFEIINAWNHGMVDFSTAGFFVSSEPGPRGKAKFHSFNSETFWQEAPVCHLFKIGYPEFEWDTTKPRPEFKGASLEEVRAKVEAMQSGD